MLQGCTALVTGGTRGIGNAIAQVFSASGARVAIVGRSEDAAEASATQLGRALEPAGSAPHLGFGCDIQDPAQVEAVVKKAMAELGSIDVLVNAAGVQTSALLMRTRDKDIDHVLRTNLFGTIMVSRAVLRGMFQKKRGSIINIGSAVGTHGNAGQAVYAASKAGIVGFTKSLSKEVGSRGIRVNLVSPGFVATDMTAALPETQLQSVIQRTSLGRVGKPEEVASAALFLASDMSSFVTGADIPVDGGLSL